MFRLEVLQTLQDTAEPGFRGEFATSLLQMYNVAYQVGLTLLRPKVFTEDENHIALL